ncbi:hypothetical protein GCM10011504_23720 [Siccirubricoccus deserti]|nr:hypothetical protein GCM10011504_23720 [Siccirubricoccus deserti]
MVGSQAGADAFGDAPVAAARAWAGDPDAGSGVGGVGSGRDGPGTVRKPRVSGMPALKVAALFLSFGVAPPLGES